jgi:endonuclease/exonuclease/phosphatase (EEP) superfamily protein YafD
MTQASPPTRWKIPSALIMSFSVVGFSLAIAGHLTPAQAQETDADQCISNLGATDLVIGEELEGDLDILSWNIQKSSNLGWAEDLARFTGNIDLAFIQEASSEASLSSVIAAPLYQAFAAGYTTKSQQTGVMTLSASSPSMHCNLTAWEPWLGTPKATSVTEYPLRDRTDRLLAINVHAVNFALGLANFQGQFRALKKLLSEHQGPIILAGDLNTWSNTRQAMVDAFLGEHGLSPVTFEPDLRTTTFGKALDHVYIRGLHAKAAEVIPVSSSDHNPLRVRLGFMQ